MKSDFYICRTKHDIYKLIKACKKTGYCCFDYETNGKPIYNNDFTPTLLSVSFQPGVGVSIPLDHFETTSYCARGYNWKKCLKYFANNVLENSKIVKMAWNMKFDDQVNLRMGIKLRGTILDGILAKYILNEERPNGLKEMVEKYLPEFGGYQKEGNLDKIPWDKKPLVPLAKYGCLDVDCTFRLTLFFEKRLMETGLYYILRNLYMPASRVVTEVEKNGLYLNRDFNQELLESYKVKIEEAYDKINSLPRVIKFQKLLIQSRIEEYIEKIEEEISNLDPNNSKDSRKIKNREDKISRIRAGEFTTKTEQALISPVNVRSNKDLIKLLYSKQGFKFPIIKYTQKDYKDTDTPSTDEETLKSLRREVTDNNSPKAIFLDNLLNLRALEKMYKVYILGWSQKVQDDNKLHGNYLLFGTTSGRLSSSEPNMQQIPKTSVDPNIKKQLIASPGKLYLVMDFSQAELRMMAHLSNDETYLTAFRENRDPHLSIAAKKYGVPYEEALEIYEDENHPDHKLWKVRRKQAKQIAFGLIYGIQAKLLSVKLSDPDSGIIVTPEEAQKQKDEFFQEHPNIEKFVNKQEKFLVKHGYVESLFGTRRRLPQIYSENNSEAAYAIRLTANFPCQCAASHMTLFGSILNFWDMKQGNFPQMDEVATVHDAVYYNTIPENINCYTIWKMWETFKNPKTKEYFNFQIDDVEMSMDFSIGRSMAEELPFIPGYDYSKMLDPEFNVEEYLEEAKKFKNILIKDYPNKFPQYFKNYD